MRPRTIILFVAAAVVLVWTLASLTAHRDPDVHRMPSRSRERVADAPKRPAKISEKQWRAMERLKKGKDVPTNLAIDKLGESWLVRSMQPASAAVLPYPPDGYRRVASDLQERSENPGFLGQAACAECHETKAGSFAHTAHARTSRVATSAEVSGPLDLDRNKLETRLKDVGFEMVSRDDRCYQQVQFHGWQFEVPVDYVIGSSKMGESYAYWHNDQLYQSVVTYLTAGDRWINSPGYDDGDAAYTRPILARCASCHFTYMDYRGPPNHYTPDSVITGVTCERCHGPGKDHVRHHQENKNEKLAKFITLPSDLPREQQLQLCGQCHSPATPTITDPFAFRPGDALLDHYVKHTAEDETGGVHASNQINRLKLSRCFSQSEMVCQTCHNPHQQERGNKPLFSERCLSCHQEDNCSVDRDRLDTQSLSNNCIDCHMPSRASEHLRLETSSGDVFPPLRDHYIRIDQDATDSFIEKQ